jgi:glycosyltransferase involved in cell wall biosynthesis
MRILQISTHATLAPRYGGPLRSHHIAQCLEATGFDVRRLAVCWRTPTDIVDAREPIIDLRLSPYWQSAEHRASSEWVPYLGDYYSAFAVAASPELKQQFETCVSDAHPDVVMLQHPWTWPIIREMPAIRSGTVKVVYSSHNVEAALKRQMFLNAGIAGADDVLDDVEAMERDLTLTACATIACTPADREVYCGWGAERVVVANNGAVRKTRDHLVGVLPPPLEPHQVFALFIGSRYPPNITGFVRYVAPALRRLRPCQRIAVAGTVAEQIDARLADSEYRFDRDRRLVSLGFVDNLTLDALIANAAALLLPIEYGGGSHLKTAEALASGRPIIGTPTSFRGFEEYTSLPQITIAETPAEFETAMQRAFCAPRAGLDTDIPREVLWDTTLQAVPGVFQDIFRG